MTIHTGIFFGSFNPIHIGHLIIANTMLERVGLDKIMFVVSPQNPLKEKSNLIPEYDRLEMVRRAVYENSSFELSDIEFKMPRPSYTIDTLSYLYDKYPERKFSVIIGQDNLEQLPRWKNFEKILEYYPLLVYPRAHSKKTSLDDHEKIQMIEAPIIEVSASFIRDNVKKGLSIKYLVPQEVEQYILEKKIFL
jgi:nicotinate-nucleotide adenylyltransferase